MENAHPAILTLEEAEAILEVNGCQRRLGADRSKGHMASVHEEVRALGQQQPSESLEIARGLVKVDEELGNIRQAIKAGLDDLEWANSELTRLKAQREELPARQERVGVEP